MPNPYLSPFSLDDAPRAQDLAAVRRSQQLNGGTQADTPTTTDPDKGNWGVETARSVAANVGNNYSNLLPALYKGVTGDMEGMRESARAYQAENENAKLLGPEVQEFDGSQGVGHNLQALAYQGANMLPDMVGGLGAGAIAGGMARRFARKAIVKSVMRNELAATAEQIAAKRAAADAAGAAARTQAVAEAGSTPAAVSARVRGAMASSDDAFKAASMKDALAFAGRTPSRVAQLDRATAVGSGVGVGLSQVAGLNTTNAERLASEDTDQGDAQALLAGTGVAAAISFVPVNRLLSRFGPAATAEVAQMGERFLPRVMREYAAQGLREGVTEATQQAAQLASHAWIDKNWDTLVGSDARNEILMSGVLGGVMGGAFGAAGEVGRSGVDAVGSGARAAANVAGQAKAKILESIAKVAETRRQAFKDRPAAGEPMEGEASEPSTFSKFMKGAGEMATDAKDLLVAKTQIAAHKFGIQLDALEEGDAMESEAQQRADALQAKLDEAEQTGSLKIPGDSYPYVAYPDLDKRQNLLLSYVHPAVREDAGVRSMLAGSLDAMLRGKPLDAAEEASLADLVESGAMNQLTLDFLRVKGPDIGALFDQVEQGRKYSDDTDAEELGYGRGIAQDMGDAGSYADDGQTEVDADNVGDQQAALLEAGADVSETDAKIDETDFNSGINTTGGVNPLSADERMLSTKKTVDLARERMAEYKARPDADPRHIAALQGEIARALKENKAARDELVQTVLGKPSPPKMRANGRQSKFGKPFGAFVFDENPKAQDEFAARLGKPEFVALKAPVNASLSDAKPDMRRGLLNIAHATQSMASNTRTNDNVSEEQKYRDAFFKVLQNAMLARVGLDYDTLTPGPVQYAGRQKAKLAPEEMTDAEREAAAIDDIDDAEDGAPATTLFTLTQTDIDDLKGMSSLESKAERAARLVKLARKRMAAPSKENTKRRIIGRKAKELKDRISDAVRDIRLATRKAKSPKAIEARIEETIRKINKVAKSKGKTVEPDIARRAAVRTVNQQLERELLNHPDDVRRAAVRAVSAQLQRELIEGKDKYVAAKQDKKLREMADLAREDPSLLDEWMAQYAKKRQPTDPTVGEWKAAIKEDSEHIEAFAEWMLGIWRANAQRGDEGGFDERFDTPYMERPTQLNVPYEEPRGEVARNAGSRRFEFAPSLGVASDVKLSDLSGDFTAKYKAAVIEAMRAKATARDVYEEFGESDKAKELRAVRKQHGPVILQLQKYGMRIKKAEAEAAAGADATHAALIKVAQAVENQTYHAVLPRLRKENGTSKVGDAIDEFYDHPWKFNALEKYARLRRDRADYIADSDMVRELAPVDGGAQGMDVNPHTVFVDFVNSREGKVVGQFIALQREYDELAAEADAAARAEAEAARVRAMDGTKRKRTQAMLDKAVVNAYDALSVFLKHRPTRDAITAYEAANAEYAAELEKMLNVGGVPTPEAFGRAMWIADINAQRKSGAMSETVQKLMLERAADESIPLPERFRPSTEEEGKASLVEAREDVLAPLSYSRAKLDPAGRALLRRAGEYTAKLLKDNKKIKRKDQREPSDRELIESIYAIMDNNRKTLAPAGKFDAEFIATVRQLVDGWPEDNRVVEALDAYDAISGGKAMRDIESAREAAAAKAAAAVDMSEPKPEPKTKAAKAAAEREKAERAKARLAEKEKANARLAAFNERADAEIAKALKLNTVRDNDVVAPKVRAQDAVVKPQPKPGEAVQYDELAGVAQAAPSEHDNTKYQAMANATLEAAGVKHSVKVVSGDVNSYDKSTKTITLRDDLKGGERVEVLMHEVGHHILWNEIAKHVEGGWGAVKRDMSLAEGIELLQHGNPKLHRALMKDFNAWRSTHRKYAGKTDLDIRASRAPMLRSQRAERYSAAGKGRRATRADFTGADVFHEWVADQIARALTTQNKPRTIIESFFADIAKALRSAWDALTGGQRNKYAPYDSVDNWVAGMFDPARAEASEQIGETATEGQTETALRAAFADAYDVNDAESMKAYVKDVLRPEERLILEQALSTPAARKVLAEAYAKNKTEREALGDAEQGLENRIALAYPLWKAGEFKVGPKGSSAFNGLTDNLLAMIDVAGGSSMAERIFTDIASGKIERVRRAGHKYDVRQVEARARGKRQQAFNKVAAAVEKVMRPLDRFWTSVGARLEATGVPALRELRSVLVRPQGATGDYDRGVTPAIQHSTGRWMQRAQHILEGLSDKHRVTTIDAMQRKLDGEVLAKKPKEVQRAVKRLRKFFDDFHDYAVEAGIFQENQKRENHFPVVMDLHDDYAVQKLTEVYSDPRFEAAIRNLSFFREVEGKGPASSEAKAKPAKPAAPLKTEAQLASADARRKYMKHIADKQHEWPAAVHAVNSSLVDAIEAAPSLRSLEGMLKKSQEREIKWQDNGAVVHAIGYEQRYIKARMKEFGDAPAPKAQTKVEALEAAGNNAPLVPSTRPIADLVKELVARTTNESRQTERVFDPVDKKAKGERSQLSAFVYELGDAAIIKKFASVQSKDMAGIMAGYIEPMVRRAEAARYFGAKREKLDALLERARHEGATDTDIDLAEDSVKAALGTYGADGSPTIAALSPSLAAKLHGDSARGFMEGMQAYQNARLLPLSLLSSLVDPLGIAVRTGGDMSLAYDSWKEGMRSLRDVATRKELQGMLEQIGSADDMPAIAFTAGFGSHKDSLAHKVNETVFKWNGMSTWVRTTRYMAVVAAHGFLLKHGRGESEQSRRYLAELNLQPREIPRDPNNKHRVELLTPSEYKRASGERKDLDDRLKSALQEFVDNAVLRPNSTQQPLWYSDPYMGLITQYKAFGYAIFNQIGGRIAHEWKHGNHRVLLAAMAYVPVGMMAELLREFIQYGFDGHPKRAEWGATDYASLATQRSGLFGPQTATLTDIAGDFQYRRTPGASLTGPVIGQATNFMDGKDTAGDFESALPASPLWKNHINPLGGGEPATPGTAKPAHQPLEARV